MRKLFCAIAIAAICVGVALAGVSVYTESNGTIQVPGRSVIARAIVSEAGINSKLSIYDGGTKVGELATIAVGDFELGIALKSDGSIVLSGDNEATVTIVYE